MGKAGENQFCKINRLCCPESGVLFLMSMLMAMCTAMAVGPAFGHEGCSKLCHRCAKLFQHFLQHQILADQNMVIGNLAGRWRLPTCQAMRGNFRAPRAMRSAAACERQSSPSSSQNPLAMIDRSCLSKLSQKFLAAIADTACAAENVPHNPALPCPVSGVQTGAPRMSCATRVLCQMRAAP